MSNYNIEQLFILISSFDNSAKIKYSEITGNFYLSNNIYVKDGKDWKSINEHKKSISEAVINCYKRLQGKEIKIINDDNNICILPILIS